MLYCCMEAHPPSLTTGEITATSPKERVPFASLAETFPPFTIKHHDLLQLGFGEDEIAQLSTHDLAAIAQTIREHLIHEWLPQELRFHVTERLSSQDETILPLAASSYPL